MIEEEKITAEISAKFLSHVAMENGLWKIDADGMHYRELNNVLRALDHNGAEKIEISNVYGQRYIGTDLDRNLKIDIFGTPGNDLGAFMDGQSVVVHGSAQDCCGNTMNDGQIVVHGHAGDITGYGMRGGKIFIRDDVGYRTGIHMKEFLSKKPYLVVGGTAQDFLGEYMAGGVLLVLGLNLKAEERHKVRFVGTGMHGGVMYVRGDVTHLGKEVKAIDVNNSDLTLIQSLVKEFCGYFNTDFDEVMNRKFLKVVPFSHRPYGSVYAY
jgi:glutamate synthase domain-containing protein 3